MRIIHNIADAPTETLIQAQRKHHVIATLGHNAIIRDYYKTQALTLTGGERVTKLLPRRKPSLWRSIVDLIVKTKKAVIVAQGK